MEIAKIVEKLQEIQLDYPTLSKIEVLKLLELQIMSEGVEVKVR